MDQHRHAHGFLLGGAPEDLFRSAAPYYAKYRRPYPKPVIDLVVSRFGLDGTGRLLDAGCGTGQVFQGLAASFADVLAVDRDPEMVRYARRTVDTHHLDTVRVRCQAVEDVAPVDGPFRMTTFGASFHWTDRVAVGDAIYDLTEPGGALLVFAPNEVPRGGTSWERTVEEILARHAGQQRRAGSGAYKQGEPHQEALARTRFVDIERIDVPVDERWTVEEVIGHLKSTSYASPAVLGDVTWHALETDLNQSLTPILPADGFVKVNTFTLIQGRRRR